MQQHRHCFLTVPWTLACPHLEDNTSHTPNVNLGVVALLLRVDDFWCHPEDSTLHRCVGTGHIDIVSTLRDTKV